jgi:hypothetical protein
MRQLFGFLARTSVVLMALISNAQGQFREPGWRTFVIPEFGTRVEYPASLFAPAGRPGTGVGERFERADGRAVLSIYSRRNRSRSPQELIAAQSDLFRDNLEGFLQSSRRVAEASVRVADQATRHLTKIIEKQRRAA